VGDKASGFSEGSFFEVVNVCPGQRAFAGKLACNGKAVIGFESVLWLAADNEYRVANVCRIPGDL
jgi:hypothetical protein